MRRTPLYSSSSRPRTAAPPDAVSEDARDGSSPAVAPASATRAAAHAPTSSRDRGQARPAASSAATATAGAGASSGTPGHAPGRPPGRLRRFVDHHPRWMLLLGAAALVMAALSGQRAFTPTPRVITQDDIDRAVRHTLEKAPLPSFATKAYEKIAPSVVHVRGESQDDGTPETQRHYSGGTGVVITDKGVILTNLHVVAGSQKLKVMFADGTESEADLLNAEPEHDLAVLKARKIPDDLVAATLRSTGDLAPGDHVMPVGFPFGIGPTVSAGVVSGLKREFRSPEGQRVLTNLIQFDAMANPGSSGGPLVTAEGEVVGIVTAILNPSQQRTFIGIGFAVPIENAAAAAGMPPH